MRLLLGALAALIVAVGLGHLIASHPGVVAIGFEGKVLRMSLALFVVLILGGTLLVLLALYWAFKLLTFRRRWRRWREARAQRGAQLALNEGLLALAAGDYARAERTLERGARHGGTAVHYLAAAQAAHALNAPARRDAYLALAEDEADARVAVGLRRAEMLIDQGEYGAAEAALAPLVEQHGDRRPLLLLRHRLLAMQGRHDELVGLLPALRKHRVYGEQRLAELEGELAARRLAQPTLTREEVQRLWQGLAKPAREQGTLLLAYARALLRLGADDEVEALLRKALAKHWDARLVQLYGELETAPIALLGRAEVWRATHPEDPALLLALGRLSYRAELWGKAREYLEAAVARQPSAATQRLLADTYDRLGEPELARRARAQGLDLATSTPPPTATLLPAR
ncbi:MAG: heme biosynthesis HemY N-terminal domain-containing protein [Gammaproteobacteria bacterium]